MKNKLISLAGFLTIGLLAACSAFSQSEMSSAAQVFPTATKSFLFQGSPPIVTPQSVVSFSGAPTVASIFRTAPSATPTPVVISTLVPASTATQTPPPPDFTVNIYGDGLNPNWEADQASGAKYDLKSSSQASRNSLVVPFTPRAKGDSTLLFTVSDQSEQVYPRDQAAKLTFWLYSPKVPLYLDQFFITIVGSNSQPYWNAKDESVNMSDYQSVFPRISLEQLGFDHAIPADTWVMAEIDLSKMQALEPAYQYLTAITLNSAAGLSHMLLIDDIHLTLLSQPSKPAALQSTPPVRLK